MTSFILFVLCCALGGAVYYLYHQKKSSDQSADQLQQRLTQFERRFAPVIRVEDEVNKITQQKNAIEQQVNRLNQECQDKLGLSNHLQKEIDLYNEQLDIVEMGLYKPHFDFADSEEYKVQINSAREQQKQMVRDKKAVYCTTSWEIEGNAKEGEKFVNKIIKLAGRAFTNECEAAIANVTWNNVQKMNQRITKAFDDINKLNELSHVVINPRYKQLKLDELNLVFEHRQKLREEKEEQSERKRQAREEEKLEQEQAKAEQEEQRYQRLLEQAQRQAQAAVSSQLAHQSAQNQEKLARLNSEMAELSAKLAEAHAKSERAKSMAQQTKAGHVYVISNIGSFGENVYKIGMTRRLDPMDRVDELSSASVPFIFDVHAIVYSDNAPEMENALHRAFADKRLNMVNMKKEFFHVALEDIKREVHRISPTAEFAMTAEAEDYRKTLALRQGRAQFEPIIRSLSNHDTVRVQPKVQTPQPVIVNHPASAPSALSFGNPAVNDGAPKPLMFE